MIAAAEQRGWPMWLRRGSVDWRGGSPRNNGPELLEPIAT